MESEAQTQQTQKMQNLMEKNENSAQKSARFHFFHSIFSKSKYMSHPFSISTYRKSKIAPMRHNCVAGINFSGKTAVSKISYQVLSTIMIEGFLTLFSPRRGGAKTSSSSLV